MLLRVIFLEDQAKFNYGLNAESMYHRDSIYELYLRMPTGKEEIFIPTR